MEIYETNYSRVNRLLMIIGHILTYQAKISRISVTLMIIIYIIKTYKMYNKEIIILFLNKIKITNLLLTTVTVIGMIKHNKILILLILIKM